MRTPYFYLGLVLAIGSTMTLVACSEEIPLEAEVNVTFEPTEEMLISRGEYRAILLGFTWLSWYILA